MAEKKVFCDHDGTLTNDKKEQLLYQEKVYGHLSEKLGIPEQEISEQLTVHREFILANPTKFSWRDKEGRRIVGATADLYQLEQAAALEMLQDMTYTGDKNQLITEMFHTCSKNPPFYYPDAADFIQRLNSDPNFNFSIVTNSKTDTVQQKLHTLLGDEVDGIHVIGDAKKYVISAERVNTLIPVGPQIIPPYPLMEGVYLNRPLYYRALYGNGGDPENTAVIGNCGEMDLLMPHNMGSPVALKTNEFTPPYEQKYFSRASYADPEKVYMSDNLSDIAEWILEKVK